MLRPLFMFNSLCLWWKSWPFLLRHVSLALLPTIHSKPAAAAATLASSSNDDPLLRRVFQLIDADSDGQLSPFELHHHLSKLGLIESFQEESVLPDYHLQFHDFKLLYQALCRTPSPPCAAQSSSAAAVEENCSGSSCSLAACNGLHDRTCCCHAESAEVDIDHILPEAFAVFDVDGDGRISVEELRQVLVRMGFTECQNEAFCASIVSTFDSNSDGYIDLSEFCVMMNYKA